jgi:hypothetical protein
MFMGSQSESESESEAKNVSDQRREREDAPVNEAVMEVLRRF